MASRRDHSPPRHDARSGTGEGMPRGSAARHSSASLMDPSPTQRGDAMSSGPTTPPAEAGTGLAPWAPAELPAPPVPRGLGWVGIVGPGVIVLGLSIGSGEFLL